MRDDTAFTGHIVDPPEDAMFAGLSTEQRAQRRDLHIALRDSRSDGRRPR